MDLPSAPLSVFVVKTLNSTDPKQSPKGDHLSSMPMWTLSLRPLLFGCGCPSSFSLLNSPAIKAMCAQLREEDTVRAHVKDLTYVPTDDTQGPSLIH